MEEMKWNDGQKAVLESAARNNNVLVSAAAGSGKTAVLVERIADSVMEGRCGIDEILVVTFTKAAAAQMKAKITARLEEKIAECGDRSLIRQLSLVANADISTIDSFCNRVVRENFQAAEVDPAYDILDRGESELLREDILEEVLSDLYRDKEFAGIAQVFIRKAYDDSLLKNLILQIYRVSEGFADQDAWISRSVVLGTEDAGEIKKKCWARGYTDLVRRFAAGVADQRKIWIQRFDKDMAETGDKTKKEVAEKLKKVFSDDLQVYGLLSEAGDIYDLMEKKPAKFTSFVQEKTYSKAYDPVEIGCLKKIRDDQKDTITKLIKDMSVSLLEKELPDIAAVEKQILKAVYAFRDALMQEKKRRKKYDFGDIAHFAYRVLYDREAGQPTKIGEGYAAKYKYIYIDEYQDGSDMQEHILTSVARKENGVPYNIFMVGDVKQSIYRFRQARPRLFLDKEKLYRTEEDGEVLYLNRNYRSRKEILEGTNHVFRRIMREDFGGILYDKNVQLNPPEKYVAVPEEKLLPELLLLDPQTEDKDRQPASDALEAVLIGTRIKEMVEGDHPALVPNEAFDKKKPEGPDNCPLRKARYGDVVILQRSVTGCRDMIKVYEKLGIPVQLEDPKAYFDAEEVVVMLSVLQVIDNARQDIPYAAVLHSEIGNVTDAELAYLAMHRTDRGMQFYDAVSEWLANGEEDAPEDRGLGIDRRQLRDKLATLHGLLRKWKRDSRYISISQLIDRILTDTDYRATVARFSGGDRRLNNLMQLSFKADDFEQAGNHGLFAFLRYIDKCKIHEMDFGEIGNLTEGTDAVRVCTIHSSKGLEFPIVFVARLGKQFNQEDYKKKITVSADYGLAPHRIRKIGGRYWLSEKGLVQRMVNHLDMMESLYEEERLLYVAMTRAKTRLVLTGTGKDLAGELMDLMSSDGTEVPFFKLMKAKSYLDFLLPAIFDGSGEGEKYFCCRTFKTEKDEESGEILVRERNLFTEEDSEEDSGEEDFEEDSEEAFGEEDSGEEDSEEDSEEEDSEKEDSEEEPRTEDTGSGGNTPADLPAAADIEKERDMMDWLEGQYAFSYPYQAAVKTPAKLAVSEIKHEAMDRLGEEPATGSDRTEALHRSSEAGQGSAKAGQASGEAGQGPAKAGEKDAPGPEVETGKKSGKKGSGVGATDYGTGVHRLMELLPFARINSMEDMEKALKEGMKDAFFTEDLRKAIRIDTIKQFYSEREDSLFQRMKRADERGELYKEQQFLVELPARRLGREIPVARQEEEDPAGPVLLRDMEETEDRPGGAEAEDAGNERFATEETVVLQGVIDGFFLEQDASGQKYAVLMDYKTDRVDSPDRLIRRYYAQLSLYKETIEDILQLPVREMWLYGFSRGMGDIPVAIRPDEQ